MTESGHFTPEILLRAVEKVSQRQLKVEPALAHPGEWPTLQAWREADDIRWHTWLSYRGSVSAADVDRYCTEFEAHMKEVKQVGKSEEEKDRESIERATEKAREAVEKEMNKR